MFAAKKIITAAYIIFTAVLCSAVQIPIVVSPDAAETEVLAANELIEKFIVMAKEYGFNTDELIFVEQE